MVGKENSNRARQDADLPLQGKIESANEIYEKHGEFIREVIHANIQDKSLAEDIFQDFYLSLVSKPVDPIHPSIRGYLYRAIKNDIIDSFRRIKAYGNRLERYAGHHNRPSAKVATPEEIASAKEETKSLFAIVEKNLNGVEANAIKLRYNKGYDTGETATIMKIKKRSVSRYTSIGVGKLRLLFGI
ncbi:hypothetical protein LCGC14_2296450 [marine sediment metagenome]|uniref:RNA polymerase sigma-70 region 2 domain-containing protein n=1 Tax=marine sediment metagenome TaxID=412755 RepID=A0A0F9DCB9_9ZZZZ